MKNKFYVYLHIRLDDGKPFYVGKGSKKRSYSKYRRNKHWENIVNKYGFDVIILESNLTEEKSYELEKYWINRIGRDNLCNMTDGGEGVSSEINKGIRRSPKTEFKKGMIPLHKGKTKYEFFINNRPAEYRICKNCNNNFLARIDKNTIYCSKKCYGESKIKII